jgi:hypothetical protein
VTPVTHGAPRNLSGAVLVSHHVPARMTESRIAVDV